MTNLTLAVPQHVVSVVPRPRHGLQRRVAYAKKRSAQNVLSNGAPVVASKTVLATWAGETDSCKNPPTGDCTTNEFEAIEGGLAAHRRRRRRPARLPRRAKKKASGEDDAQDLAQEELLKGATVGVGMAIVGKI